MEFNDQVPIYIQIIDDFRRKLVNGTYKPGQEIPSRREMAKTLSVNPNTVQRAYKEMEDAGLIQTARGQGSIITNNPEVLQAVKREMIGDMAQSFIESMKSLGLTGEEIISMVRQGLTDGESNH